MALPLFLSDLAGTLLTKFKIGSFNLKSISGGLAVRNAGDSADAELTASKVKISGPDLVMNSDAAESAADWSFTFSVPASGMTANLQLFAPVADGSTGQALFTDGSGHLYFDTIPGGVTNMEQVDDTTLAFGDSSPVSMFTKPAGAKMTCVVVYVDTAFNGTAPTLSIGITGTLSKYVATTEIDLKTAGTYIIYPDADVAVGSEAIIGTYNADSSSAGAARIEMFYAVPN
jgi:hypothetical protein